MTFLRRPDDCFSWCVSTLTGIDIDLLPVHPPTMRHYYEKGCRIHVEWSNPISSIGQWDKLLRPNGYILSVTRERPRVPCVMVVMFETVLLRGRTVERIPFAGHAVVLMGDSIIDPNDGKVVSEQDYIVSRGDLCPARQYVVLTPVTGPDSEKGN